MKKPPRAAAICRQAVEMIEKRRVATHGDAYRTHTNIAELWNAFLAVRRDRVAPLSPADVAKMMVLLKMARSEQGDYNPDNHIDGAAYFGIAGELDGKQIK